MNKFSKILSTLLVVIISAFALASCKGEAYTNNDFYEEFFEAGATNLEKDHMFEMITANDVEAKRNNNENFIIYLGSSKQKQDVETINALVFDAKNTNYDGKVFFINLDLYEGKDKKKELNDKLGIKYDGDTSVLCVCYVSDDSKKSKVEFTTTKLSPKYEEMFEVKGNTPDVHALAAFTFAFNSNLNK